MAADTTLTVDQWLKVRERVADKLKTSGSEQRAHTRLNVAEGLMSIGYIDIATVLDDEKTDGDDDDRDA